MTLSFLALQSTDVFSLVSSRLCCSRYNISHSFVTDVVDREISLGFDGVPHSSFDVRFCEVAVHELGHTTESALEELGYKSTDVMANFAGTLTLPGD